MNTVLIVDDFPMNRKIVKTVLSNALKDISMVEAENGVLALDYIYNNEVSVIILDIMMPEKDGIEVLTEIKQSPIYQKIPVIICTAIHETDSLELALSLGALDYFTKPLREEDMRITLPLKVKNALEVFDREAKITKLYEHIQDEMLMAEQLQKSLFLRDAEYENATIQGEYIPCNTIGGDLLCKKVVDGNLWFMIADVAGHGITAAMLSAMVNSLFHLKVETVSDPAQLLKEINNYLCNLFTDCTLNSCSFGIVTTFAGCIKNDKLSFANAGHPYPLYYNNKTSKVEALLSNGLLLGFLEDTNYVLDERIMESGDIILCYTDGLFDNGKYRELSSWEQVQDFCLENKELFEASIIQLIDKLIHKFRLQGNGTFVDDVAVIAIKKN